MKDAPFIVTGASSGIGFALCVRLLSLGCRVIGVARGVAALDDLSKKFPEQLIAIQADLSNLEQRNKLISQLKTESKFYSGLVNNAGTSLPVGELADIDLALYANQFAINLEAPVFLTQALLPQLEGGGRVINVTTATTKFIASGIATYAMSKAALNVFTAYLSNELAARKILLPAFTLVSSEPQW